MREKLWLSNDVIRKAVAARTRELGLTPPQFWVLVQVLETDMPSLSELAERLRIDQPMASRVVTALVGAPLFVVLLRRTRTGYEL